jgi:hypothetical protein
MLDDDTLARLMAEDAKRCRVAGVQERPDRSGRVKEPIGVDAGRIKGAQVRAEQFAREAERFHGSVVEAMSDGEEYSIPHIRESVNATGEWSKSESAIRQAVNILIGQGVLEMASEGKPGGKAPRTFRVVR